MFLSTNILPFRTTHTHTRINMPNFKEASVEWNQKWKRNYPSYVLNKLWPFAIRGLLFFWKKQKIITATYLTKRKQKFYINLLTFVELKINSVFVVLTACFLDSARTCNNFFHEEKKLETTLDWLSFQSLLDLSLNPLLYNPNRRYRLLRLFLVVYEHSNSFVRNCYRVMLNIKCLDRVANSEAYRQIENATGKEIEPLTLLIPEKAIKVCWLDTWGRLRTSSLFTFAKSRQERPREAEDDLYAEYIDKDVMPSAREKRIMAKVRDIWKNRVVSGCQPKLFAAECWWWWALEWSRLPNFT